MSQDRPCEGTSIGTTPAIQPDLPTTKEGLREQIKLMNAAAPQGVRPNYDHSELESVRSFHLPKFEIKSPPEEY